MAFQRGVWIGIVILVIIIFLGIFIFSGINSNVNSEGEIGDLGGFTVPSVTPEWMNIEFKDIKTGEMFKISDFIGKPVLLESFAVWCPTCTNQQKKIKELHNEVGNEVVSISLDTDPNEDENRVIEHIEKNGFNWYYAVSPPEATELFIGEFGVSFINAPSAPIVLICGNGNFVKLDSGVKSVDELKSAISNCGD